MSGVKLELLTDIDMHLVIEKGISGEVAMISHRFASANNSYLPNYDASRPNSFMYWDANNMYRWAMSQNLPTHDFSWAHEDVDFMNISENSDVGYIFEVDLEHPHELNLSNSESDDVDLQLLRWHWESIDIIRQGLPYKRREADSVFGWEDSALVVSSKFSVVNVQCISKITHHDILVSTKMIVVGGIESRVKLLLVESIDTFLAGGVDADTLEARFILKRSYCRAFQENTSEWYQSR
ncbi:hypothetical protein HNY73_005627 [Argiope bruennichi]|uniref:DNA-directed DNA polymerase n=1 Tax=Argiope bruennichi TaxID=94029 RepID=A0A8T0FH79_ARGBR|nr:hypothetical protein HNY73_005627 [Argiope bruennichi]